ncbi:MAG: transglutaminase domain-containing protein [Oscillospiraceae bacterium]|nr:transglutaminase domain-containing protein [Oscillospiraceae bacterium]
MRRKANLYVFSLMCALLLSSCTSGNNETTSAASEQTVSVTTEQTEISEISEETSQTTEISEIKTETVSVSEVSSEAVTSDMEQTSETSSEIESAETEIPQSVTEIPETKTETTSVTTAATTASKPKAEVVIPKINMPKTGDKVISGDNAEADYSYASEGYISAMYSGSASAAKVRITCGDIRYDHDLTPGKREFFPLMGSGSYSVQIYEQLSGNKFALLAEGNFEANISNNVSTYLYPNKYVDFDGNSACVKKAAEVCAGITDDVEKIAEIFSYVTENVSYDKNLAATVQSGYVPYPDNTLSKGKGICFDYTSLFAAMCRSQGIPARLVIGYAEPEIYHAWNEVYTDETGWITPELFLKKKGYNITDATFYSSNSNKEKISAYISDDGNYLALYRY